MSAKLLLNGLQTLPFRFSINPNFHFLTSLCFSDNCAKKLGDEHTTVLAWGMSGGRACCIHAYKVYTSIGGKAGVAPDMTLRFTACKQVSVQAREPPWHWNPWGGSHEVQNRGNQQPHKMDLGPTKKLKR